jgi:hypothetical protein
MYIQAMTNLNVAILTVALFGLMPAVAQAPPPYIPRPKPTLPTFLPNRDGYVRPGSSEKWFMARYSGSLMEVVINLGTGLVQIKYGDPRPELAKLGVQEGFVLLEGRWQTRDTFVGKTQLLFPGKCGWYPQEVTGRVDKGGGLVVSGPEPVMDPKTCEWLGSRWGENSTLRFEPVDPSTIDYSPVSKD